MDDVENADGELQQTRRKARGTALSEGKHNTPGANRLANSKIRQPEGSNEESTSAAIGSLTDARVAPSGY